MDANSIISAFIASSNQYVVCQNETNMMQLQRHLEILVCLTTTSSDLGFFQNGNPLASQCITHVVNLLLETNAKCTLIPRALSILQNLAKSPQLNKSLQTVFHVHSAISVFLQHHGIDVKDPLVLQCFHLLENVTYNISISYIESHFENLINSLLKLIDSESSQLLRTTLRILTNLTRHNVKVQNYICSLPTLKQNVKKIVAMLNTEEPHVLVYALSILANLTPNYPIGAKLWTDEHLMTTFKLIIKLLFGTDETCAVAALDLFLDLIKVPKYQSCFIKSPYLNSFLKRIPKVLEEGAVRQSVLYLQILYALSKISDCYEKVCTVLLVSEGKDANNFESSCGVEIHPKIVEWCTSKDINEKAPRLSLKLLIKLLDLHIENNFNYIKNSAKEIVKNILQNMSLPCVIESNLSEKQLDAHISVFKIIILLCKKANLSDFISQYVNLSICEKIATMLLEKCKIEDSEEDENCINLFLMVLEVISVIEDSVSGCEKISCKILKDLRAMQFLAYSLTSTNSECIKRGLLLTSLTKDDDSLNALSKNLFMRHSSLLKRSTPNSEILDCSFSSDAGQHYMKKGSQTLQTSDSIEKTIDSLLLKIEQGLNIKELKRSEIMDLYEHKIAVLTRKEQELQNYIEAKTAALQKADQIMTQYKCRQADSDAEALRLRTLLKEFESRSEKATVLYEEAKIECKRQKEELDIALCKIKQLQQHQNEQKELMQTQMTRQYEQKKVFEEEKARFTELLFVKDSEKKALLSQLQQLEEDMKMKCKLYEELEESKDELTKKIEEAKKFTEKMKLNYEQKQINLENALESAQQMIATLEEKLENITNEMNKNIENHNKQILDLEGDKEELKEQLKLKDSKITDLDESIKKLNLLLSEKTSNLKEVENLNNELKSTLEKTENKSSKLEQDVKMLELLCKRYETSLEKKDNDIKALTDELEDVQQQYEQKIQEKDSQVKHLEAELEKHKYITGMIHQMTSGKIPVPKTDK